MRPAKPMQTFKIPERFRNFRYFMALLYLVAVGVYIAGFPPISVGCGFDRSCSEVAKFIHTFFVYLAIPFATLSVNLIALSDKLAGSQFIGSPDPLLFYILTAVTGLIIFYLLGLLVDKLETKLYPPKKKRTPRGTR